MAKAHKVTVAGLAEDLLKQIKQRGLPHALDFIKKLAHRQVGAAMPEARLLVEVARRVQAKYPAAALDIARHALSLDDTLVDGWLIAGYVSDQLGNKDDCLQAMTTVLNAATAKPEQVLLAANLLIRMQMTQKVVTAAFKAYDDMQRPLRWADTVLYIALRTASWTRVDELCRQLSDAQHAGEIAQAYEKPRNHVLWCADEAVNLAVLKNWSDREILPKTLGHAVPMPDPLDGRRIRVGYLSSDFREHPTSRLANGLFRHHDRTRFELFMYCSGWDDGSDMRKEVVSHFDHVHSVAQLSDQDAADLIRGHRIDVLVELNGPTRANRMGVLAYRPAPVQIDYLGWPGSVGGNAVDYVIGDNYTVPRGAEQAYPEKVIRLDRVYQVNDYRAMSLSARPDRKAVGLPEDDRLVLGMFNAINKVRAEVWAVWMSILKHVPNSVLWILDPGPVARRNIARWTQASGIDVKRIIAAPALKQQAHLDRLQCCDLMLDPWPYGGHTSTSDALFANVPVLVLEGTNFAGRVSGALLHAAGMGTLVCKTKQAYVRTAVSLLRKPEELARVKEFMRQNVLSSNVFDAAGKTAQFEAAYVHVVQRKLDGLPTAHLQVKAGHVEAADTDTPPSPLSTRTPIDQQTAPVSSKHDDAARVPLVVVCGPWGSGTSAVAGMLARAGLQAPGPHFRVNDPKTPDTFEMTAFRDVLLSMASEQTLKRSCDRQQALDRLREFRDTVFTPALAPSANKAPALLKHGLAVLFLPELCELFDVRLVGVLRPLSDVEATRQRRRWRPSFGATGAKLVYAALMDHLLHSRTRFHLLRYPGLLEDPGLELARLLTFCGHNASVDELGAAIEFVTRKNAKATQP